MPTDDASGTPPQPSEVEKLRDEFAEQFATMKAAFENEIAELKKTNQAITAHNQELERALIRSAVNDAPPSEKPKEKTEAELYDEKIQALAKKAIERL